MTNEIEKLPGLLARAVRTLEQATSAAEVLEAAEQANFAYKAAKMVSRLSTMTDAHDEVRSACRKMMADALIIEARADCRLADEYDAAQERGEVQKAGGNRKPINITNSNNDPTVRDIGLTSKKVHEARIVRDAEKAEPGIVQKTVEEKLQAGQEPTRADVKRATRGKRASTRRTDEVKSEPKAAAKPGTEAKPAKPAQASSSAQSEINRLRKRVAELEAALAAKSAPLADVERRKLEGKLHEALHTIDQLREQLAAAIRPASAEELKLARNEISMLQFANRELKREIAAGPKPPKPVKPPLDPESEATRQIKGLKTRVSNLTERLKRRDHELVMA